MGDELSLLLEIFNKIEKAGGQATLCVATGGGKTKVKLEITTTPAPPTGSTPTSSGRRQRRRGPRARARRNQRAAAHQAALAEAAATSAPLRSPTPRLLPSVMDHHHLLNLGGASWRLWRGPSCRHADLLTFYICTHPVPSSHHFPLICEEFNFCFSDPQEF